MYFNNIILTKRAHNLFFFININFYIYNNIIYFIIKHSNKPKWNHKKILKQFHKMNNMKQKFKEVNEQRRSLLFQKIKSLSLAMFLLEKLVFHQSY